MSFGHLTSLSFTKPSMTNDRTVALVITLIGQGGHAGVDLGFERCGQHAPVPLGASSSRMAECSASAAALTCTFNIGDPSSLGFHRQPLFDLIREERTRHRALSQVHPQVLVGTPSKVAMT